MRLFTFTALFAVTAFAVAEDKKEEKPLTGAYTKSAGDLKLKMAFKKDNVVDFTVDAGDAGCVMTCKYTKEKDGTLKCEVTNFEKKGDFPVTKEKGYKFSFKTEMKDKKLVVSDLKADDVDDVGKQTIEGEYEAAKSD